MPIARVISVLAVFVAVLVSGVAFGQGVGDDPIVIIEIDGPMDQRLIDYTRAALEDEVAHAFVLKIDSPGASSGDLGPLFETMATLPVPVISWIGPTPAAAFGGAAYVANHADVRTAAPGIQVGYLDPAVHKGDDQPPSVRQGEDPDRFDAVEAVLSEATRTVSMESPTIYGFVDRLEPALGQLILSLDGEVVERSGHTFELSTAGMESINGVERPVATRPVKFIKTGLLDRFLRLGARPETAFLFLLVGLAFAMFEFYAAGGGLMAFVASMSLITSGYGLATLPIWWPAVAMVVVAIGLLVWGFGQNRTDWRAIAGSVLLVAAGALFTTTRPQYPPAMWMVLLAVGASVAFIWYALTTVVRGRFATPTVGREDLLGRRCLSVTDLDPEGVVLIDGERWLATADRGIEIQAGAPAEIVGLTGLVLEVDPLTTRGREESR
ncbi:MAG: NfeD family protein [Actinomycetota bacterium]